MSAISANLTVMIRAAEKAARSLVRDFNEVEKLQISVKGPGDFVSRADKRSEEIIVESLQKDRPEWGFLAEEGTSIKGSDPRYRWIIDPLDGTTNFLHGLPHWAINIALEKDGDIVAALTMDPLLQETFRAEKGTGAFMNNSRLQVSGRKDLNSAIVLLDCAPYEPKDAKTYVDVMVAVESAPGTETRIIGSSALDLAYLAAGRVDLCYMTGGLKPWDIAPGILLVREARGIVTDHDLKPAHQDKGYILAGNAELHPKFAQLIGMKSAR